MARPTKGAAAKSRSISVRMTEAEEKQLASAFGDPRRGLRALLDNWKASRKDAEK